MSSSPTYAASPADWRSDPNLRQVDVVVYTTAGTFVGHTYRTSQLRLLDVLNKGFAASGVHVGMDYIPMTEVDMYLSEGGRQSMESVHISKASVLFVAEKRGGQPKGDGGKSQRVIMPKKLLEASLCLPPYILVGRLHRAAWAELATGLHQEETFIPLTRTQLSPPLCTGDSQFDFVAVNQSHIVYVAEAADSISVKAPAVCAPAQPSRCETPACPQPARTLAGPPLCPKREEPLIQPNHENGDLAGKSLLELAEEVANKVRALQREKSRAGVKIAGGSGPDAVAKKDLAVGGAMGIPDPAKRAPHGAEEELQAILDSSRDGIILVDANHRILRINKTIAEASGCDQQEVRGTPLDALISPQNLPRVSDLIKKSLCGLPTELLEVDASAGSDHEPPLRIQVSTVRRDNQIVGAAITTRKAADRGSEPGAQQPGEDCFGNAKKMERTMQGIIEAMMLAVEARDQHAVGHQRRVAELAHAIALEMGRSPELGDAVRTAGLLHDVGKIFIPVEMLTKHGKLSQDELATIKSHPKAGYEVLKDIEFPWPVAEIVLQHHERMNGSGYPAGLKGDEIRLEARILGVADTVEAMLHPRSYRSALGMDEALGEIRNNKGVLYDGDVVKACLSVFLERGFKFRSP